MIRLEGEGKDITFFVKDQNWIPCYGKRNIPDGELFSSPILDSVNGHITYAPSVYQGKPFEFVKLEVKNGTVTDFNSSDNASLEEILSTRSEEHTSELQSRGHLVCRLLLEKKKKNKS